LKTCSGSYRSDCGVLQRPASGYCTASVSSGALPVHSPTDQQHCWWFLSHAVPWRPRNRQSCCQ